MAEFRYIYIYINKTVVAREGRLLKSRNGGLKIIMWPQGDKKWKGIMAFALYYICSSSSFFNFGCLSVCRRSGFYELI